MATRWSRLHERLKPSLIRRSQYDEPLVPQQAFAAALGMLFVQPAAGGAAHGLPPHADEPRELLSEPEARSRKRTKWGESPWAGWSLVTLRLKVAAWPRKQRSGCRRLVRGIML